VTESKDNGLRVGPYELVTRLAAGRRSEAFIARRILNGGAHVGLKLLLPQMVPDHEFVERFFDQARVAMELKHPNLEDLQDLGKSDGRPYLVTRLVEGVSVQRLLEATRAKGREVPLPIVRAIGVGLLEGLGSVHAFKGLGLLHRAIGPSKVLVSKSGEVVVHDVGFSKAAIDEHLTRPSAVRATLAPEQAQRGGLTLRADLFSAAATLYELATLTAPFLRADDVKTLDAVLKQTQPSARSVRAEVGDQMSKALDRALSKKPEDRFSSAGQFRDAFVDGAVASAAELGAWVQALCGEELRAFERLGRTAEAAPSVAAAARPSRRNARVAVAVAALLLIAAVWWKLIA
jgi:serine/threonine protein kinase